MEDMLKMFSNFELIEKMCEILANDEKLKENYSIQLAYFRKNFYHDSPGKSNIEKYTYSIVSQLDNLLRIPGIKSILCNRNENLNFDKMLSDADITFICTRRGDLGAAGHKAFGLFFLMAMQNAVLRRPGNEKSRVPYFVYIDEFADFICRDTEAMFTLYRKYRVGTTITAQNLSQLEGDSPKMKFKDTILTNCGNKIFTGGGTPEDIEWWSKEFIKRRTWTYSNSMDMDKLQYDSKYGSVKYDWENNFAVMKLATLGTKNIAIKLKNDKGQYDVGEGIMNFLSSKYKEEQPIKKYNFAKFTPGVATEEETDSSKNKFDPKHIDFVDDKNEVDPIQMNTTDSNFIFDNEDAIVVNFKKNKND